MKLTEELRLVVKHLDAMSFDRQSIDLINEAILVLTIKEDKPQALDATEFVDEVAIMAMVQLMDDFNDPCEQRHQIAGKSYIMARAMVVAKKKNEHNDF